jgi:hypothetical protein
LGLFEVEKMSTNTEEGYVITAYTIREFGIKSIPIWKQKRTKEILSVPTEISYSNQIRSTAIVSSRFKESVFGKSTKTGWNNQFLITVKNGNSEISFEYGISVVETEKGKITLTKQDHIFAFYCFIGDAISGSETFENFQKEFGYQDCCEAYRIWKLCRESTVKAVRLGIGDLYRVSNYIQEKYPDVI